MNWQDPESRREYFRDYARRWRALNANTYNASVREKRKDPNNAANHAAATARWRQKYPDRNKAAKAKWQRSNVDKVRQAVRRWMLANPERASNLSRKGNAKRRARRLSAAGVCTVPQLEARIAYYGWSCYMCNKPFAHVDHVIPLSRGGSNWPANLRPSCAKCNLSKGKKKLEELRR